MGVQQVPWTAVDHPVSGLPTNAPNKLQVKRATMPIIFVPGVMGSRLRLKGTNGTGEVNGDQNLRWDPKGGYLWKYYSGVTPARRKLLLLGNGASYNPDFLEVDDDTPTGNGYRGLMEQYRVFLEELRTHDWYALGKLFVFPVYGFGYNWSASNRTSGAKLAARITEIIAEGKKVTGACGFRGFLRGTEGKSMQAQFKDPVGSGDGTVPTTSGNFNGQAAASPAAPSNKTFRKLEHQPAYEDTDVKAWVTAAITAIAGLRFKELKG